MLFTILLLVENKFSLLIGEQNYPIFWLVEERVAGGPLLSGLGKDAVQEAHQQHHQLPGVARPAPPVRQAVARPSATAVLQDAGGAPRTHCDGHAGRPRLGDVKRGAGGGREDEQNSGRQAGAATHCPPEVQVAVIQKGLKVCNVHLFVSAFVLST